MLDRWVDGPSDRIKKAFKIPGLLLWIISRRVKKMAWGHGMGRHSVEEVIKIGENDCKALSVYLGKHRI